MILIFPELSSRLGHASMLRAGVAHANGAVELLNSKTEEEASAFAEKVNIKNDLRREFDLSITEEALAHDRSDEILKNAKSTVYSKIPGIKE